MSYGPGLWTSFPALSQESVSLDPQGRGKPPATVPTDRTARDPGTVPQENRGGGTAAISWESLASQ